MLGADEEWYDDNRGDECRFGAHPFTDAEIKEGKGASMTLTDAAGKVIKAETYTRKPGYLTWSTAIGRVTRKAVGSAIARARNAAGLSVRDLADRCGLDAGHLCRIENGRMNVNIDTVAKICEALGLRLEAVSVSETKENKRDRVCSTWRGRFCSLDARGLRSLIFGQVVQHVQPLGVIRPPQRVAFGEDVLRKPDKMFLVVVEYGFVNIEVVPPTDILSIVVDAFLRHFLRS